MVEKALFCFVLFFSLRTRGQTLTVKKKKDPFIKLPGCIIFLFVIILLMCYLFYAPLKRAFSTLIVYEGMA